MSDSQWKKNYDRDVYESDRNFNYQKSRDAVADSQWAQEFALQKKSTAGRSRGGSGGGGSASGHYLGSKSGKGSSSNGGSYSYDPAKLAAYKAKEAAQKLSKMKKKK